LLPAPYQRKEMFDIPLRRDIGGFICKDRMNICGRHCTILRRQRVAEVIIIRCKCIDGGEGIYLLGFFWFEGIEKYVWCCFGLVVLLRFEVSSVWFVEVFFLKVVLLE